MAKSRKNSSYLKALESGSILSGGKRSGKSSAAKKRRSNYTSTYDSGIVVPF